MKGFIGWNWTEFIKGWINKKFVAWLIATHFVNEFVHNGQSDPIKMTLIIAWGAISIIWMLSTSIEKLVGRGSLNVDLSAKVGNK